MNIHPLAPQPLTIKALIWHIRWKYMIVRRFGYKEMYRKSFWRIKQW